MPYHITAENARELAIKARVSWLANREAKAAEKAAKLAIAEDSCEDDQFAGRRLERVRKQLNLVDAELEAAVVDKDCPKGRIVELSTAQDRLQKQEQALAMRPSPGVLKPSNKRSKQAPISPFE
jgi:hypothetical protein